MPLTKGQVIYTVSKCKIEKYYVETLDFTDAEIRPNHNISHSVIVNVERYKEPHNSYKTNILLAHCFLSKEELINQL